MTKHDYKQNAYYLMYLIRCILNNSKPAKEKLGKMDLSGVFAVAKAHSLTAIAAYALESAGIYDKDFEEEKNKSIRKTIILDAERENVLAELEKSGIWYMPLKGIIIKDLYPQIGMRQMADCDILCDQNKMAEVKSCMSKLSFETHGFGISHQDVYHKMPITSFEMHSSLLEPRHGDVLYNYYRRIKSRLIKDADNSFGFHFSNEDFYIYFIAHEYKHFANAGIGLRSLVDTYIILRSVGKALNRVVIVSELKKLGLYDFEKNNRELVMKCFLGRELSETEYALLDKYIFSGTYGNVENRVANSGANEGLLSKIKYISDRIKLPEQTIKEFYPFYHKHKYLRPIMYSKRLINTALESPSKIKSELRELKKQSQYNNLNYKAKLKRIAGKIIDSPLHKPAKICYDAFILLEYHTLIAFQYLKGYRKPTAEESKRVSDNVTFIYKSFERQYMAKRLFKSIQKYYPRAHVIIADDSKKPLVINSKYADVINLPYNSGLSFGLNRAIAKVRTPYTFRMDDDELLTLRSKIYEQLIFLDKHKEIDLVGIQACSAPFPEKPQNKAKQYVRFNMKNSVKPLIIPHMTRIDKNHYIVGKISNVFLVHTDKYRMIGYDDNIKRIDHHEFFYRAAGTIVSAMDTSAFVFHYHNWFDKKYSSFRDDVSTDVKYIFEKHGKNYKQEKPKYNLLFVKL